MKQKLTRIISVICLCSVLLNGVLFAQLYKTNVTVDKPEQIESMNEQLQKDNNDSTNSNIEIELDSSFEEPKQVTIGGSFAALVRDKMPNYVLDDTTPNTLVATLFQDSPFIIHTSAIVDLVEEVEAGKVYIFEIEPKVIGTFKESELDYTYLSPHIALNLYGLQIANIYEVDDEETYSLHGAQLRYVVGE